MRISWREINSLKKQMKIIMVLGALILLTGCSFLKSGQNTSNTSFSGETEETGIVYPITLKLGYSTGEEDPRGLGAKLFKETVESETGGDIIIDIYPSGEIGSDSELIRGVIDGTVDMTVSSEGNFAAYATRVGISALPYLFTDFETAWKFMDSDIVDKVENDLEDYNIHVLSHFDNGFRCVTTSQAAGEINSVTDMSGLVIRTPENQIVMETISELGANPKSFPFTEVKDALAAGEFDGQENPIPVIYNSGLYEVQKYLAVTNHSYDAMPFVIRNDLWINLSKEYQDIISKAAISAQEYNRGLVKQQTSDDVSKLEDMGMIITYPDLGAFQTATKGVADVFSDIYGEELVKAVYSFTE